MSKRLQIVVLIPTVNEATLDEVVGAARGQLPPEIDVVILGFGAAARVAQKHAVRLMDTGKRTPKSVLLNRAVAMITADGFIVLDADAIPQPGWAQAMLAAFEHGYQLFSASVDVEQGSFWMRVYNFSMLHEFTPEKHPAVRRHLPAISLGFTRAAFDRIGPFREDIQRSEDFEWTLRAVKLGLQPYFLPAARVVHRAVSKDSFCSVMAYWRMAGLDNWRVRHWHADLLGTPPWMRWPALVLILSPLLALAPTLRIAHTSPHLFFRNFALLPFVYLTKLAWCWGLYSEFKSVNNTISDQRR